MSWGASKKNKAYHFHTEWEEDFLCMSLTTCICLICHSTITIPEKGNVERHF